MRPSGPRRRARSAGRCGRATRACNRSLVANLPIHKRRRFQETFRRRVLLSDDLFEPLCVLGLDALPSSFDLRIFNSALDKRCVSCLRLQGGGWRDDIELGALPGLTEVRSRIGRPIESKSNLRDMVIGPSLNALNRRSEAIDSIGVGDNVGNISGLPDELKVPLGSFDKPRVAGFAPMRIANKCISGRPNIIVRIGPRRYRLMRGDVCFGRKRGPANVIVIFPPRDPGRRPLSSGDPTPPRSINIGPSPVVVGCPTKTLI